MADAYQSLGLEHGASGEKIDAAYRRLVRRYPPELNPRRFAEIKQAYEFLRSYERRMREAKDDFPDSLALLFPPIDASLGPPPDPPEPLTPADWERFLDPLREEAIRTIVANGLADRSE